MKKKKRIIILILIFSIILLLNINLNKKDNVNKKYDESKIVNEDNGNTKNVAIVGMKNIFIKANTKNANVNFVNPIENKDYYYQTFELKLLNSNDEYEVLYKSDLVEPGKEINEIILSRELEKGEYDVILHVQPYRMDKEKTPTSDAQIKVKLIVE